MTVIDPMISTPVLDRTTAAVLERNVDLYPDKVAITDVEGLSLTYRELQRASFSIANALGQLGIGRQENVLVMLDNNIDNAVVWLGITVGARVEVPINTAFKGEMLRYICAMSQARVLIIEGAWCDRLEALVEGVPELATVVVRHGADARVPERFHRVEFDTLLDGPNIRPEPPNVWDLNAIMFTSGTTGPSKGVMTPHGHAFSMASHPPITEPDEVLMVTLPLFHNAGLIAGVYNAWRVGGTAVIVGTFSASKFWDQVREFGCTNTVLLGAQAEFLWRQPQSSDDRSHTLREACIVPTPPYAPEFTERFGVLISAGYGLSESGTIIVSEAGDARPANCGRPRSFAEVRLVDENDIEVKRGEVGEIVIRTSEPWSTSAGYYGMPEETAKAWRNLWLHSGDAAYQEEDGSYVFVDRRKDALRRRGENVSSFEVERHFLQIDAVAEVAVVAVPSEHSEDELKAFLVLSPDASFDPVGILQDLVARMPYFMVPRFLEVIDGLPKTPTHKVRKVELREMGVSLATWDCEAAGYRITREGLMPIASK